MTPAAEARVRQAVAELADALVEALGDAPAPGPARLLSVDEAAEVTSLGRSKLYGLIASGDLRSVKVGRRRPVPAGAVAEFIRQASEA